MNKRLVPLVILIAIVALLAATLPAFGAPPKATPVSGLECVYVDTPGEMEIIGQTVFIRGQVNVNRFYSDDPTTFPDGTNTAVLDALVNLRTGMVVWSAEAVFQPDGVEGTFEGIGHTLALPFAEGLDDLDLALGVLLVFRVKGVHDLEQAPKKLLLAHELLVNIQLPHDRVGRLD